MKDYLSQLQNFNLNSNFTISYIKRDIKIKYIEDSHW